jgi:AcrR family transcriptional regulator
MSSPPNFRIRDEVTALKRERTIEAAVELFYERGYENTTLDVVAERMGVFKPFIYAHFNSKMDLLAEICSRGIASSLQAIESIRDFRQSPTEKLTLLGQRFVTAVLQSQKHVAIFMREEKNLSPDDYAKISGMRREFDAKLRELLNEGIAAGEFKIKDVHLTALAIGGMVSWAYVWYRPNGRLSERELADVLSSLILSLVGVGQEGRGGRGARSSNTPGTKRARRPVPTRGQ